MFAQLLSKDGRFVFQRGTLLAVVRDLFAFGQDDTHWTKFSGTTVLKNISIVTRHGYVQVALEQLVEEYPELASALGWGESDADHKASASRCSEILVALSKETLVVATGRAIACLPLTLSFLPSAILCSC